MSCGGSTAMGRRLLGRGNGFWSDGNGGRINGWDRAGQAGKAFPGGSGCKKDLDR